MSKKPSQLKVIQGGDDCSRCGGLCCLSFPGFTTPQDWQDSNGEMEWGRIEEALRSRKWVIDGADWMSDEHRVHVRPADVHTKELFDHKVDFRNYYTRTCVFWSSEAGCALDFDSRPTGCKVLIPKLNDGGSPECYYSDDDFVMLSSKEWEPHRPRLFEIGKAVEDELKRKGLKYEADTTHFGSDFSCRL